MMPTPSRPSFPQHSPVTNPVHDETPDRPLGLVAIIGFLVIAVVLAFIAARFLF